jgi:hypothetical protein
MGGGGPNTRRATALGLVVKAENALLLVTFRLIGAIIADDWSVCKGVFVFLAISF